MFLIISRSISAPPPVAVKNGFKGETDTSDDEVASEVLSHHSSASESASAMEESAGVYAVPGDLRGRAQKWTLSQWITLPVAC